MLIFKWNLNFILNRKFLCEIQTISSGTEPIQQKIKFYAYFQKCKI